MERTEQIVREAPQIEAYKIGLLERAREQSMQPYQLPAYEVAGMSPQQVQAEQLGQAGIGAYQPFLQAGSQGIGQGQMLAQAGAAGAAGMDVAPQFGMAQTAMQAGLGTAGALPGYAEAAGAGLPMVGQGAQTLGAGIGTLPGAMQGYSPEAAFGFMNPYQQAVTQQGLQEMRRQADIARQGMAAQAVQAGAFGGTREGVQRAEFERGVQDVMSQRVMEDFARNFGQAQQASMAGFEAQQQRQLAGSQALGALGAQQAQMGLLPAQIAGQQGALAGQGAQLFGQLGQGIGGLAAQQGGLGLQQASTLGQLGQAMGGLGVEQARIGQAASELGRADIGTLANLGAVRQANEQARLDAARATQMQQTMAPYQQLGFLSDIYKGAPTTQMALTAQSAPSPSPMTQALGLGISGLSAAAGGRQAGLF